MVTKQDGIKIRETPWTFVFCESVPTLTNNAGPTVEGLHGATGSKGWVSNPNFKKIAKKSCAEKSKPEMRVWPEPKVADTSINKPPFAWRTKMNVPFNPFFGSNCYFLSCFGPLKRLKCQKPKCATRFCVIPRHHPKLWFIFDGIILGCRCPPQMMFLALTAFCKQLLGAVGFHRPPERQILNTRHCQHKTHHSQTPECHEMNTSDVDCLSCVQLLNPPPLLGLHHKGIDTIGEAQHPKTNGTRRLEGKHAEKCCKKECIFFQKRTK